MAGTPITQKANLQIMGNLILSGAGGYNLMPAAQAILSQTVTNAAQPNITSVGTLSSIAVTGNASFGDLTGITILGGNNGQYLQTDGYGALSWVSGGGSGNGVVGGANTQIQFNNAGDFGGSPSLTWDQSNAQLNTTNFAASQATIYGNVDAVNFNATGNVKTNAIYTDNFFYANGDPFSGGNVNTGNITFSGDEISSTHDVVNILGNNYAQLQSNNTYMWVEDGEADIEVNGNTWVFNDSGYMEIPNEGSFGALNSSILAFSSQNNKPIFIEVIDTGNSAARQWVFDNEGNLTLPANTFAVNYANGDQVSISGGANTGNVTFDDTTISTNSATAGIDVYLRGGTATGCGAIGGNSIILSGLGPYGTGSGNVEIKTGNSHTNIWTFDADGNLTLPGSLKFPSNYSIGPGEGSLAILSPDSVAIIADQGNTDQLWLFGADGTTRFPTLTVDLHNGGNQTAQTLQFGNPGQQAIITGPTPDANVSAQRLIIQGQRGNGELSEGGDVYVWAGDADTNGGDIKIYAGDADNVSTGQGGYVNIDGGAGFDNGGDIELTGGTSANGTGGFVNTAGGYGHTDGGAVNIQGGHGQIGTGGAVGIYGGSGPVQGSYGNVEIGSGTHAWLFDNSGNLTLPANTFAVNYANGDQVSISGGANTGNVTFDDNIVIGTGDEFGSAGLYLAPGNASIANSAVQYLRVRGGDAPTHIHLDTGNNQYYDQYFGADGRYVKLEANGNVVINADDYFGNSATWTLDTTGNLYLPDTTSVIATVSITLEANDSGNITGLSVIGDANANLYAHGNVTIVSDSSNTNATWAFGTDGNLTVPGSLINDTSIVLSAPAVFNICTIATAGSGYNTGSSLKATTGGSGSGMTVGIGYGLSNQLTSVNVVNPGTGYVNGDVITVSEGTGGTFVITKYNVLANQTNNNTVQTDLIFANNTVTLPIYGEMATDASMTLTTNLANAGNTSSWTFDNTGNLTLPNQGSIVTEPSGNVTLGAPNRLKLTTDLGDNDWTWNFEGDAVVLPHGASLRDTVGNAVAIGLEAGYISQGNSAVAIGANAGYTGQGISSVAIGSGAGSNNQGNQSVAIGENAGVIQGSSAVAIGKNSGGSEALQGDDAVAIGHSAGESTQGTQSVAIGLYAGQTTQGVNAIAIGANAGITSQGNNSIILNATGANLDQTTANTFTVKPVRQANTANAMYYDASTGEITYDTAGSANTGNVTFDDINIIGTGNLKLQPDSANTSAYLDIFLTAGPDIHIAGNGETVILGTDDYANVAVNVNGNVSIQANAGTPHTWNFGTDGNLTFPTGNLVITPDDPAGNIASIASTDHPLGILSTGANGAVSSLWVEDIGNVGTSNIAAVYANPTPESKIVRIAVGQNGSPGPNLWDFGTDGNLTIPGGGAVWTIGANTAAITANLADPYMVNLGLEYSSNSATLQAGNLVAIQSNTGANSKQWSFNANGTTIFPGDLIGNGASPAPSINNFNSISSLTLSASGNITGGNISATGNVTAGNIYATNIVAETLFSIQTANFNANVGGRYGVDTTGGAITATLPASPATGGAVFFADAGGAYVSNNLTIDPNGQTIMGASGNMTVSNNNQSFGLFFNGATWRTYN